MKHLFIHCPKTGGLSIRYGLPHLVTVPTASTLTSADYVRWLRITMKAAGEHDGLEHARWVDCSKELQALPAFGLVRNPWARCASRYFFARQIVERKTQYAAAYRHLRTFEDFLEERHEYAGRPFYWHRAIRGWYQQLDHFTDAFGHLRCAILRTEHLDDDVEAYLGQRPPRRRNVTANTRPYAELYTPRTIQIVADWYARDLEFFGFDFDTSARLHLWEGLAVER